MRTFEEILDEVCQNKGFGGYEHLLQCFKQYGDYGDTHGMVISEAAEIYAKEYASEACERQKQDATQWFDNNFDCYADTWQGDGEAMIAGDVVLAMSKEKFLEYFTPNATDENYKADNWVNVEERLPENRTYVLGHYYNGYDIFEFKHGCFFIGYNKNTDVTHWQPLPQAPKQD